jgi:hypothetical protein
MQVISSRGFDKGRKGIKNVLPYLFLNKNTDRMLLQASLKVSEIFCLFRFFFQIKLLAYFKQKQQQQQLYYNCKCV